MRSGNAEAVAGWPRSAGYSTEPHVWQQGTNVSGSPETLMHSHGSLVRYLGMNTQMAQAWDARVAHLLAKLPKRVQDGVEWLRYPPRRAVRLLASAFLVLGGLLSILPVLGLWMLPLGLALLSDDIPRLKIWLERAARWTGRMWRRVRGRPAQR